ncbi:Transcription factor BHLH094 [Glycine soja]
MLFFMKVLEEKKEKIAPGTLLGTTHTYVVNTGTQDKSGAKRYEEAREEKKLRNQCEDSSDMVAEARREKISERMKILQDLVSGFNKVVGAAIIFEVQRSSRSEARKEELCRREIHVVFLPFSVIDYMF